MDGRQNCTTSKIANVSSVKLYEKLFLISSFFLLERLQIACNLSIILWRLGTLVGSSCSTFSSSSLSSNSSVSVVSDSPKVPRHRFLTLWSSWITWHLCCRWILRCLNVLQIFNNWSNNRTRDGFPPFIFSNVISGNCWNCGKFFWMYLRVDRSFLCCNKHWMTSTTDIWSVEGSYRIVFIKDMFVNSDIL